MIQHAFHGLVHDDHILAQVSRQSFHILSILIFLIKGGTTFGRYNFTRNWVIFFDIRPV